MMDSCQISQALPYESSIANITFILSVLILWGKYLKCHQIDEVHIIFRFYVKFSPIHTEPASIDTTHQYQAYQKVLWASQHPKVERSAGAELFHDVSITSIYVVICIPKTCLKKNNMIYIKCDKCISIHLFNSIHLFKPLYHNFHE